MREDIPNETATLPKPVLKLMELKVTPITNGTMISVIMSGDDCPPPELLASQDKEEAELLALAAVKRAFALIK